MRNNLEALNEYLFTQLDRITNEDMTSDELQAELQRSEAVVKVGNTIIQNATLALNTIKHMDEYGYNMKVGHSAVPKMLESGDGKTVDG